VGTRKACQEVKQLLKQAGFGVTVGKQGSHMQASITAVMTAFVAGLELSGWAFRVFRKSPWLKCAARASREMVLSQLPGAGIFTRALLGILLSSVVFFLTTVCLPLLFPFNIEKYLKFHYLKTREQSLTLLDVFVKDGERRGLPMAYSRILLQGLL
jgi:2-dehydropantoate 2-reductase